MRFLLKAIGFLLATFCVVAAAVLGWGHVGIRRVNPPLPSIADVLDIDRETDLPVRLTYINTASQVMPRAGVLDPGLDADTDAAYTMSHVSFVVEWQDGRILLLDLGMDSDGAMAFGEPLELLAGAEQMQPLGSTSDRLGDNRARVAGIAFTHMHQDHTGGITTFCQNLHASATANERIPVFQNRFQMLKGNHTTRTAKQQLDAARCIRRVPLVKEGGMIELPGFPGVFAISAAGHTPGSQMFVAHLRTFPGQSEGRYNDIETWVITGDVVNHIQGIERNIPKPRLYRLLMVPENEDRLTRVRALLKDLSTEPGVRLLVSHDQTQIAASGLRTY